MGSEHVVSLTDLISTEQIPTSTSASYARHYRESRIAMSGLTVATVDIPVAAGDNPIVLPRDLVRLLHVWWDNTHIERISPETADHAHGLSWRDKTGTPTSWVEEEETAREILLVPGPAYAGTLKVLYAEATEDGPRWADLPHALAVLAREFALDSSRQQGIFALACRQVLAEVMRRLGA